MLFQGKDHSMTYLDLVPKSFEQSVSLVMASTQKLKSEVPGSSHDRRIQFLVFRYSKLVTTMTGEWVKFSKCKHTPSPDNKFKQCKTRLIHFTY